MFVKQTATIQQTEGRKVAHDTVNSSQINSKYFPSWQRYKFDNRLVWLYCVELFSMEWDACVWSDFAIMGVGSRLWYSDIWLVVAKATLLGCLGVDAVSTFTRRIPTTRDWVAKTETIYEKQVVRNEKLLK